MTIISQKNIGTEENVLQMSPPLRLKSAENTLDIIPIRGIKNETINLRKSIELFPHTHCTKIQNLGPKQVLENKKKKKKKNLF